MPDCGPIRVVISLRTAADPIEGEFMEPEALAGHFQGWLALASLIESARIGAPGASAPSIPEQ
jgi:hypothetical protein